jgi:hypothetical protein
MVAASDHTGDHRDHRAPIILHQRVHPAQEPQKRDETQDGEVGADREEILITGGEEVRDIGRGCVERWLPAAYLYEALTAEHQDNRGQPGERGRPEQG